MKSNQGIFGSALMASLETMVLPGIVVSNIPKFFGPQFFIEEMVEDGLVRNISSVLPQHPRSQRMHVDNHSNVSKVDHRELHF